MTAEYPDIAEAPVYLHEIAASLSDHYGVPYDGLWLNLYGTNGTAPVGTAITPVVSATSASCPC